MLKEIKCYEGGRYRQTDRQTETEINRERDDNLANVTNSHINGDNSISRSYVSG